MTDEPSYVIIVGAARSGTKFVRELVGASSACAVVPFDVPYVWRRGNESVSHDAIEPNQCSDEIARRIDKQLRKLSGWRRGSYQKYIVEKTVATCLRVPLVERALTEPKYIHIIRDGRAVVESSLRQWQKPVSWRYVLRKARYVPLSSWRYGLWYLRNALKGRLKGGRGVHVWGVRYPGIDEDCDAKSVLEICARQWTECVRIATRDLANVPAERQIEFRYESLVERPEEVHRICEFLDLPDANAVQSYYQEHLVRGRNRALRNALNEREWGLMEEILMPQLEALGY